MFPTSIHFQAYLPTLGIRTVYADFSGKTPEDARLRPLDDVPGDWTPADVDRAWDLSRDVLHMLKTRLAAADRSDLQVRVIAERADKLRAALAGAANFATKHRPGAVRTSLEEAAAVAHAAMDPEVMMAQLRAARMADAVEAVQTVMAVRANIHASAEFIVAANAAHTASEPAVTACTCNVYVKACAAGTHFAGCPAIDEVREPSHRPGCSAQRGGACTRSCEVTR